MATPSLQLFLDRFKNYNTQRYADNAEALNIINSLTLEQISFSNWRDNSVNSKAQKEVDMLAGNMRARNQKYYPLDYMSPLVSEKVDGTPLTEAELAEQSVAGIYFYNDADDNNALKGAVVVKLEGDNTAFESAVVLIKSSCKFDIEQAIITDVENQTELFAMIETDTITGILKIVQAAVVDFIYDGTYKYDGSRTY